jgi:hypothetical protein
MVPAEDPQSTSSNARLGRFECLAVETTRATTLPNSIDNPRDRNVEWKIIGKRCIVWRERCLALSDTCHQIASPSPNAVKCNHHGAVPLLIAITPLHDLKGSASQRIDFL